MVGLREAGYRLYVPFSENTRCDLVIDDGATLERVQIKTGRLRRGAVWFYPCSSYAHHPNPKILTRHYQGEVDYFGIYCPETGGVYLVPIEDVAATRRAALRVQPSRNSQRKRIRPAADYEIYRIATREPGGPSGAGGSCA